MLLLKINSSSKKIMFFNGEFLKAICNRNSTFLLLFIHNIMIIVLFPWTCATIRIHSLSGRILNITTVGKRPYVKAKVNNYRRIFLYDTGASRTCMTMNTFRNAFPNGTPRKLRTNSISDELYDARGKSLGCIRVYEMDFEIFGRRIKHPVRRVFQHVTEDIIGIDFINAHHLWYDPVHREVFFNKTKQTPTLTMMSETHLPCLSKVIMKVRYNGELQKGRAHIATIKSDQSTLITGGPALIKIEDNNLCYIEIEIENCSPCDIKLERGSTIATVECEWED